MHANHATRTVSKFCCNCGSLVRMSTTKADLQKPEMCVECIPYYRILQDSEKQIDMLKDRMKDSIKRLDEIKSATHLAISKAVAIN